MDRLRFLDTLFNIVYIRVDFFFFFNFGSFPNSWFLSQSWGSNTSNDKMKVIYFWALGLPSLAKCSHLVPSATDISKHQ